MCAPAGFGKTALLANWVRSGDRRVAWLSLDAADSDPVRFWRHVVAALDRARPGIGERVAPLLGQPRSSFEGLVTATTCSPTCSAPASSSNIPIGSRHCTAMLLPGQKSMAWPATPCATR